MLRNLDPNYVNTIFRNQASHDSIICHSSEDQGFGETKSEFVHW